MSRNAPARVADPEGDKRRALRLAATAAHRANLAETSRNNAIRLAADAGASLREIAAATEMPHMTVKRIISRHRESASSDRETRPSAPDNARTRGHPIACDQGPRGHRFGHKKV